MEKGKYNRRKFFHYIGGLIIAGTSVLFLFPIVRFLLPRREEKKINIFVDSEGKPISENTIEEGSYKIGFSKEGPTIVIRREKKTYAFSAVCTHLGCIVKWLPERGEFFCPCHAGRFDANGVVISGPPPRPLKKYNVEITSDGLITLK